MLRTFDLSIRYGLILLLAWTPLAFGAVHGWAYALLEVHVFLLVAVWMLQRILTRWQSSLTAHHTPGFVWTPLALPLILFVVLLIFQLIPLPLKGLTLLSPTTADLYRQFLPVDLDTHVPISLDPYVTRTALGKLLAYAALFFLIVNTLRTPHHIRVVYWAIVSTAFAMAILGVMQKWSGAAAIYWVSGFDSDPRFFGPYLNSNHFAGYQAMALCLGLGLLLTQTTSAESNVQSAWRRRLFRLLSLLSPKRVLLVFALAIMTGALLLTASRGGNLSFLISIMFLGLMLYRRHLRLRRQAMLAMAITAMLGFGLWVGLAPLLQRFATLASDQPMLTWTGRASVFQIAWDMSKDFPWFGIGLEAFPVLSPRYQLSTEGNVRYFHVHNDFLQLLAETGCIGFFLLIGGMLLLVVDIIKRWRPRHDPFVQIMVAAGLAALFAISLHSLVDFNLHIPANAVLFTIMLAMTYACARLPRRGAYDTNRAPEHPGWLRYIVSATMPWLTLIAALGFTLGALRIAVADWTYPQHEVFQCSHWIYRVDPAVKRSRLQQAQQWTPNHPYYWRSLAELEAQAAWETLAAREITEEQRQHAIGQLLRSVTAYESALRLRPTEPYTQLGRLDVLQTLASVDPPSLPPSVKDLLTWCTRVASLYPSNPDFHHRLGLLFLRAAPDGDMDATPQQFFRQAIDLDAAYASKVLQTYRSHFPEAEALRRFALTVPNTPQGHLQIAQLVEKAHWDQARLHYRTALILSQSDPAILQAYGPALLRHKEYAAAQEIWERLREATPDDANVYLGLAAAWRGLEDHDREAQILEQLVERFPLHAEYHVRLANAYVQSGQATEAEAAWKRAIDLQPHAANHYAGLARLYQSHGDLSGAILMMQRAASLEPRYHHALATLYEQSGHRDRAEQMYKQLVARQTSDPSVFYKLGIYAQQDGNLLQAIAYFRRAVQLKPDHSGFRRALEQVVQQGVKP